MPTLESGLPEHVENHEDLARFLTQSKHFSSLGVKPAAFLPNPKDRETSVSRMEATASKTLWEAGLLAAGERTLYGAAFVKVGVVRGTGLDVFAAEPPPRHAVITKWPWLDDRDMQKAQQLERAVVLASEAGQPVLRPEALQ